MSRVLQVGRERVGLATVVAATFAVTLAVNLQVPLYKTYADVAGYRQGLVSVTFAAYVAGLIPVLLLANGLADRFGNKAVLSLGLAVALAAHLAIIVNPTIQTLLGTRLLQGVSIGLSLAAATAYLVELGATPRQAARLSSGAVTLGLGSGGLLTSACLSYRRSPVPFSYYGVALLTIVCWFGVLQLKAGASERAAAILRYPHLDRQTLRFAFAIFLSWSLTGVILAAIPAHLALLGHAGQSGPIVFTAIAVGLVIQLGPEVRQPARFLKIGYGLAAAALLLLLVGVHQRSASLLFVASALSGLSSFGFNYVGGVTGTLLACGPERARAMSGYYLLGYVGLGLPCVAVGYLTDRWGLESALIGCVSVVGIGVILWCFVRGTLARHAAVQ